MFSALLANFLTRSIGSFKKTFSHHIFWHKHQYDVSVNNKCSCNFRYPNLRGKLPVLRAIILLLCIAFYSDLTFAQAPAIDIPNILPPSPAASDLGKYALFSTNMSTGSVKSSISLYTYKTRNLSLPITMDYSADGFKVDQVASRVGTGWTLNAGGAVSRTVLGNPDGGGYVDAPVDFPNTTGTALNSYINTAIGGYDTQPDVFTFNFDGNYGRFIIYAGGIKKLEQNNLSITGDINGGFTITAADGVQYLFTATESSVSVNSLNPKYRNEIKNAWFLTRITHPLGDFITLSYATCEFQYLASSSQTYNYYDYSSFEGPDVQPSRSALASTENHSSTLIKNKGVYLTGISSNSPVDGFLKFLNSPRQDISGDFFVTEIGLYKTATPAVTDQPIQHIEFNNTFITANPAFNNQFTNYPNSLNVSKRLFLNGVIVNDKTYRFGYNSLNQLPPRLSYAQDYYGYFNGKTNATLVPSPNDLHISDALASQGLRFGNRAPDWNYAKIGLLNSIKYPTMATDSITYEANTVYKQLDQNCNVADSTFSIYKEGTSTLKHNITVYSEPLHVTCTSTIKVTIGCVPMNRASSGQPSYPSGEYLVIAGLADAEDYLLGFTAFHDNVNNGSAQATVDQHNVIYVTLQPGNYRLAVKVRGDARGYCSFTYSNSYPSVGNKEVAGLRVKKVSTFDPLTSKQTTRNYTYNNLTDGHSTGLMISEYPVYQTKTRVFEKYNSSYWINNYLKFSSANSYGISDLSGNHIYYSRVTESEGENFENGGTEHVFINSLDSYPSSLQGSFIEGVSFSNSGINSHQETERNDFLKKDGQFVFLKRTKTTYFNDPRLSTVYPFYVMTTDPGGSTLSLPKNSLNDYVYLNVNSFNLFSRWTYPIQTETIQYNQDGLNPISTVNSFQYENIEHQQLTKTMVTLSNNSLRTTINRYPQEMVAAGETNPYQEMINRHQFDHIIEQEEQLDGIKLGKTIKQFRKGWESGDFILPETVKSQYNNETPEVRLQYFRYDEKGNPLELSKAGGPKISYLWGYDKSLIIGEVKNRSYSDVENVLGGKTAVDAFLLRADATDTEVANFLSPLLILPATSTNTYVYHPLTGLIQQSDQKGLTTSFDYDQYQRLISIKDRNQDIVKNYSYNYPDGLPLWQDTGNKRCVVDSNNKNTGVQEGQQRDINPLSSSYNSLRWVSLGVTGACPVDVPCNGEGRKVINGVCTEGIQVYTSSVKNGVRGLTYTCIYHYEWSDGSRSIDYTDPNHNGPCTNLN